MSNVFLRGLVAAIALLAITPGRTTADQKHKPLQQIELMALVAGNALSEDIVHEITTDGLAFHPDDAYRAALKEAGADSTVLKALGQSSVTLVDGQEDRANSGVLKHLSNAAAFARDGKYDAAEREAGAALTDSFRVAECGFVMGEIERQQENWEAAALSYRTVLARAADFPDSHTKLSYILYRKGDDDEALREARAALAINPNSPEAHKNAALALEGERKFTAAAQEYEEALRLKPDYQFVRYDLGNLFRDQGQLDEAIAEYQKAIALRPGDSASHNNMGLALESKGDLGAAIREFREAKHLDPKSFDQRANLASALMKNRSYGEAVVEFRELEAMFPSSKVCHECMALALFNTWDLEGAEKEYGIASEIDPEDAMPHVGIGSVHEQKKDYETAMKEYLEAERLDPSNMPAYRGAGRVLLARGDASGAIKQLQVAVNLNPGGSDVHDLYGKALESTGKFDQAIEEFKESVALDPKQVQTVIDLGEAYEKKGDWPSALREYRNASLADASVDLRGKIKRSDERDPEQEYKNAQQRFQDHLTALKARGKTSESAALQSQVQATQGSSTVSQKLDAAIQEGMAEARASHFELALGHFKDAVRLAQELQPHDQRLVTALDYLGNSYMGRDWQAAQAAFEQELKVAEELYGPQSPNLVGPMQSLGTNALLQGDYVTAKSFYGGATALSAKAFGENSQNMADSLMIEARVDLKQKAYDKAESYYTRAANIYQALNGADSPVVLRSLGGLCDIYESEGKVAQAVPCEQRVLAIIEKQYGPNSPMLVAVLTHEAQGLRTLGRSDEATSVEKRIHSIQTGTATKLN